MGVYNFTPRAMPSRIIVNIKEPRDAPLFGHASSIQTRLADTAMADSPGPVAFLLTSLRAYFTCVCISVTYVSSFCAGSERPPVLPSP